MIVEGRLDRILASALPHEVTHTVFAAYFGGPMPRWADEGASLLSEDLRELQRHDQIAQDLLTRRGDHAAGAGSSDRGVSQRPDGLLRPGLFDLAVPRRDGRPAALPRVRPHGLKSGWDAADENHYGLADVRELDRAWRAWHKVVATKRAAKDGLIVRAQSPGPR